MGCLTMSEAQDEAWSDFEAMLDGGLDSDMTHEERMEQLKEQRSHIEDLTAELRRARREREAKLEEQFEELESDDGSELDEMITELESEDTTPEVLTNNE